MLKRIFLWLLILLLPTALASAQYSAGITLQELIDAERASRTTLQIELTINNVAQNVLNLGQSPSGRVDRRGFNIVEIDPTQGELPIVMSLPPGLLTKATLSLEGTGFEWEVVVDPNGLFLTEFPLASFPAGQYYLTVEGIRVLRVVIPENYNPA